MIRFILFFGILDYFDARFTEELDGKVVRISLLKDDALYSAVYYHLCADRAGLVGDVDGCTVDRSPHLCGLNYGVLFGVDRVAYFMAGSGGDIEFLTQAFALVFTRLYSCGSAVIACGQYALVFYDDCAYLAV